MKIAISAKTGSIESQMDERFGRCNYFVLFDDETEQIDILANPGTTSTSGAGPAAVEELVKHKVKIVITGSVGDIAKESLQKAGIEIILMKKTTIKQAFNHYLKAK
jgi:predicted Fe-Mo cluster-binding NifX family protein